MFGQNTYSAIYQSLEVVEICFGGPPKIYLSRVKKFKSLLACRAVTNDSVFKSAPLFWDTLYIQLYRS